MNASITAVIARPDGASWIGRYVHGYGAPSDLGPILHRLAHDHRHDINALTRSLLDEHCGWNRIEPGDHRLGDCRCHDPQPAAPSWPDTAPLTPGQPARARYAYILAPAALHVQVRINGDWRRIGRAAYTRATDHIRFELMAERARALNEAHAWDTDPLN